jgi:hypothetical protein
MVAMKSASDNAKNVIGNCKLVYNKARQAAITKKFRKSSAALRRSDGLTRFSLLIRETTMSQGNIVQCIGAVVDIQFPRDAMPKVYDALSLTRPKSRRCAKRT